MLIFIGDVHGEFHELTHKLANHNIRNSTFIQVGDFGAISIIASMTVLKG
jgi:hypothetical protein